MQFQRVVLAEEKARLINEKYKPRSVVTFLNHTAKPRQNNEFLFSLLDEKHIADGKARKSRRLGTKLKIFIER